MLIQITIIGSLLVLICSGLMHVLDIYGTRHGKGQIAKDTKFYYVNGIENPDILSGSTNAHSRTQIAHQNLPGSNDADHSRYRKLLAHAFSDAALRSQEAILTSYFDLLIDKLKGQIDGPAQGLVDLTMWYNLTTFDM